MLRRKALKKILVTSLTIVILLMIYMMPSNSDNNMKSLNVQKEIEYIDKKVSYIYLLNDNDLLVKVNVLMNASEKIEEQVEEILNNMLNNNGVPDGLKKLIPIKTKVLDVEVDHDYVSINFSKNILEVEEDKQEKLVESIVYSLFEISDIKTISLYVEEENISNYFKKIPEQITRDFGINKRYCISSFKDVQKVVVYYLEEIENNKYYVPVTSYINDDEEKIKIIIESLSSNYIYEPNLISLLDSKTELINYEIDDDVMHLNFNNSIFMGESNILEEVVYTISNSVFDNYDVNKIVFNVENEKIKEVNK